MTHEELLIPRYKVIADWPMPHCGENPIKSGDILMQYLENSTVWRLIKHGNWTDETTYNPEKYPHLFKLLAWHEERKIEEMPQYVKRDTSIYKVTEWCDDGTNELYATWEDNESGCYMRSFLPATLSQYTSYINSK